MFEQLGGKETEPTLAAHGGRAAGGGGVGHQQFGHGVVFFGEALREAFVAAAEGEGAAGIQHHKVDAGPRSEHLGSNAPDGCAEHFNVFFLREFSPDGHEVILIVVLYAVARVVEQGHTFGVLDLAPESSDGIVEPSLVEVGVAVHLEARQRERVAHGVGIIDGRLAERGVGVVGIAHHEGVARGLRSKVYGEKNE